MYNFVNFTWNPIKGKCPHDCSYCYYQQNPRFRKLIGKLRLDEKCLKDNLGQINFIFVGSSTDAFANEVKDSWIVKFLEHCNKFPGNTYLFQTKNPGRLKKFTRYFPPFSIFGTTAETNRYIKYGKAPQVLDRLIDLRFMGRTMITIEPIMDFDLEIFVKWIKKLDPECVNIGADSKGHNLPEPSWDEVQKLIKELEKFTKVNLKDNLKRLQTQKSENE